MKNLIKHVLINYVAPSIPAANSLSRLNAALRKPGAVFRFLNPVKRKFYSHKEKQAFRTAANIKKHNIPGPGPPM